MKKNIFKKIFLYFILFSMIAYPLSVIKADGMIVAPPLKRIYETDQKAIIFYENGVEHLILSMGYAGNADQFAWIVPTPQKPEVTKSSSLLFEELEKITEPEKQKSTNQSKSLPYYIQENYEDSVTVIEEKQIEYYDISVLEATNKDALYNWLNDNGYSFPSDGRPIIDEYIQKKWFFTAVKINNQRKQSNQIQKQLFEGTAIPLKLSFLTDKPVYPLKISAINGMEETEGMNGIVYNQGPNSKAIEIGENSMLGTEPIISNFDIQKGRISFYLKKRNNNRLGTILYLEKLNPLNSQFERIEIINPNNQFFEIHLNQKGTENLTFTNKFKIDLGSDFKENEWQKYEFVWDITKTRNKEQAPAQLIVDGKEREMSFPINLNNFKTISNLSRRKATVGIGGSIKPPSFDGEKTSQSFNILHNESILIDELVVKHTSDKTIFEANFNENLQIDNPVNGYAFTIFDKMQNISKTNAPFLKPDMMGVLIYVIDQKPYKISGFEEQYQNWFTKEEIINFASVDGKPWINPENERYFLTKHYKHMSISNMNEDLYPIQEEGEFPIKEYNKTLTNTILVVLITLSLLATALIILFAIKNNKKQNDVDISKDEPKNEKDKKT